MINPKGREQKRAPLTFCEEALVDEAGDDVRVFEVVVVVRAKDVGRDRRSKVAPKLFVVCAARVRVPKRGQFFILEGVLPHESEWD